MCGRHEIKRLKNLNMMKENEYPDLTDSHKIDPSLNSLIPFVQTEKNYI